MRIVLAVLIITIWALPVANIFSQDNTFINYRYEDGFDNTQLTDMTEDEFGVLWFVGLTGSLYTFDGYEFRKFPLPPHTFTNNIYRISASHSQHSIYLVTDLGILKFDGNEFVVLKGTKRAQWNYHTRILRDKKDRLWLLDKEGKLFSLRNDTLSQIENSFPVIWMNETPDGKVNLVTHHGSQTILNPETLQTHDVKSTVIPDNISVKAFSDQSGKQIFFCEDGVYQAAANHFTKLSDQGFKSIQNIKYSRDGNLWILSQLKLFVLKGNSLSRVDAEEGLTNNHVVQLSTDRTGTLWVLSDNEGVYQHRIKPFQSIPIPGNPTVSSLLPITEDSIYIATFGHGVFIKGKHGVYQPAVFDPMRGPLLIGIVPYRNGILFGSDGKGLFHYAEGKLTSLPSPPGAEFVRCVASLPDIFVGTQVGLFQLNNFKLEKVSEGLPYVNSIRRDSAGSLLIGTQHTGMFRLKDRVLEPWDTGFYRSTAINFFTIDSLNNIWVSSNRDRISVYAKDYTLKKRIQLPSYVGSITSLDIIPNNKIVLAADNKFYLLKLDKNYSIKNLEVFSKTDGVTPGELVLGGSLKKNNVIWYSSTSGAYRFDMKKITSPTSDLPIVFITRVGTNVYDTLATNNFPTTGFYQIPVSPELKHNNNAITFEYRATDLTNPGRLQYHYRLAGLRNEWSPFSKDRIITFSNLDRGDYTFEVQAISAEGMLSQITRYSFSVLPAFWQTWWFTLASTLLAIITILAFYWILSQRRMNRYKREDLIRQQEASKIRQQMSMDFHDELGNKLAGILSYASALRIQGQGQHSALLEYIESSAQAVYHGTRDFIWSINLESNNLQEILIYLRDFGVKFFERHGIHFDFEANLQNPLFNHMLPEGYNRQLVLIFKEAMTNAYKHSKGTRMTLGATVKGRVAAIFFRDNGIGISDNIEDGNGVKNMNARAKKIKAQLHITARQTGTNVTVTFHV